jgi:hypothetical protein
MMQTRDDLRSAIEGLQRALTAVAPGKEASWADGVALALGAIERQLRQHAGASSAEVGPLAEVDLTRPTLARQTDALRCEESDVIRQVRSLRAAVHAAAQAFQLPAAAAPRAEAAAIPDFGSFRRQGQELADHLEKIENAETDLVLESINTDIGVGD